VLAVDLGTSSVKATLACRSRDSLWHVAARATESLAPPIARADGWSEQDPLDWCDAAIRAMRGLLKHPAAAGLAAISLSGQMQSLVLADDSGCAIRPALLYSDARATSEAALLEEKIGRERLVSETANWKGAVSVLPKLLWLQYHEPEALASASYILLSAHDVLHLVLTGLAVTDPTNASVTGLLAASTSRAAWASQLLVEAGFHAALHHKLPHIVSGAASCSPLASSAATELGVPSLAGLPVCHGAGDLAAVTIGALEVAPTACYCYLGTSGWVAEESEAPVVSETLRVFIVHHPTPGRVIMAAPTTTACGNVAFLRRLLYSHVPDDDEAYAAIDRAASEAQPGASGLLYLPYLNGERFPVNDPTARACFVGLGAATSSAELCRACYEGIAMSVRSLLALMPSANEQRDGCAHPLVLVGGGGASCLLPQILADVSQRKVLVPPRPRDVAALGAASLAAHALLPERPASAGAGGGLLDSQRHQLFLPRAELAATYDAAFMAFGGLYPSLMGTFHQLAGVRA